MDMVTLGDLELVELVGAAETYASFVGVPSRRRCDHVLVRGRWLSLPLFEQSLKLIDGISYWHLQVERGDNAHFCVLHAPNDGQTD